MSQYISIWVLYPALALVLGIASSVYLFTAWVRHPKKRPTFLLFWASALFLVYWFQVPVILTNLGWTTTITSFNFFFAITLPVTFLALSLIYWGVLDVLRIQLQPRSKHLFLIWTFCAILFFAYHFIVRQGIIDTYALPLIGNLAFYLPIRVLIIFTLIGWIARTKSKNRQGVIGASFVIGESLLGISRNFLVTKYVLTYPPQFWYVVLTNLKIFFILQTASIIFLVFGFFFLHRMYHRNKI